MMKYKNNDGIELSYDGHKNNGHTELVGDDNINTRYPMQGWAKVKKFLKTNFSIND